MRTNRLPTLLLLIGCHRGEEPEVELSFDVPCPEAPALGEVSGDRFDPVDPAPGGNLFMLVPAPSDPQRIYTASFNNGLYRSDDGGRSWDPVASRITHIGGQLAVHPRDPDRFAYPADELYLSTNGGMGWEEAGLGSAEPGQRVRGVAWRVDQLYAIDQSGDLWRQNDDGFEWVLSVGRRHSSGDGWGMNDDWFWLLPAGEDLWVAGQQGGVWLLPGWEGPAIQVDLGPVSLGTVGVEPDGRLRYAVRHELRLASLDGSWQGVGQIESGELTASVLLPDGSRAGYLPDQAFHFASNGTGTEVLPGWIAGAAFALSTDEGVLVAHAEGVALSDDGMEGWEDHSEGIVDTDLSVLLAHPHCPSFVLVGTQCERGLYASEDWGQGLWHLSEYAHYVMDLEANPSRPTELWVTTDDMVMRSDNMGYAWTPTFPEELRAHVHGMVIDPRDPERVLVGSVGSGEFADDSGRVYITEDGGETWEAADDGLPQTEASMHALTFLDEAPGVVLLGTYKAGDINHSQGEGVGLYRSEDDGWSWARVDLPTPSVSAVLDCEGAAMAVTDLGVFRSEDAGESWASSLDSGWEFVSLACRGDAQVALDRIGQFWRSSDAGLSWERWPQDPPLVPGGNATAELQFSADGQLVYAAVGGQGLYRRRWEP